MKIDVLNTIFEVRLCEILVNHGVITQEESQAIQASFHESETDQFDDFLLSEGLVDEERLLEALAEYFQVPAFDVIGYFFQTHLLRMFPKQMLARNEIIPLEVDENMMVIVANNPDNPELLAEIGENVSYDIRFYVGIGRDIIDAVEEFYDLADTENLPDDDLREEHLLVGELHQIEAEEDDDTQATTEGFYEEDFDLD